jgi:hypothetical protein
MPLIPRGGDRSATNVAVGSLVVAVAAFVFTVVQGCANQRAIDSERADRRSQLNLLTRQVRGEFRPVIVPVTRNDMPILQVNRHGSVDIRFLVRGETDQAAVNGLISADATRHYRFGSGES